MKLRSAILFGCLLVVPLVAMFSHKVPPGFREGFRERLWRPVVDQLTNWRLTNRESTAPDTGAGPADVGPAAPQAESAAPQSVVASPRTGAEVRQPGTLGEARLDDPSPLPAVALPTVTMRSTPIEQPSRTSLDERLKRLGAVGLQVKPPDAGLGVHVASCRVPVDAGGQLQRLFQANGPTAEGSLQQLVDQIEGWRSRLSLRPSESPAQGGTDEPANGAGRFR